MFNHKADESVTCDECCDNEQDHHYCMFVSLHVTKSIKCVKLYSTFYISHTIRTNGLLYLTGHNECPLLTILLT